jgi:hypothetical protein
MVNDEALGQDLDRLGRLYVEHLALSVERLRLWADLGLVSPLAYVDARHLQYRALKLLS